MWASGEEAAFLWLVAKKLAFNALQSRPTDSVDDSLGGSL